MDPLSNFLIQVGGWVGNDSLIILEQNFDQAGEGINDSVGGDCRAWFPIFVLQK